MMFGSRWFLWNFRNEEKVMNLINLFHFQHLKKSRSKRQPFGAYISKGQRSNKLRFRNIRNYILHFVRENNPNVAFKLRLAMAATVDALKMYLLISWATP